MSYVSECYEIIHKSCFDKTIYPLPDLKDLRFVKDFVIEDVAAYFKEPNPIYKTKIVRKMIVVTKAMLEPAINSIIRFSESLFEIAFEFLCKNCMVTFRFFFDIDSRNVEHAICIRPYDDFGFFELIITMYKFRPYRSNRETLNVRRDQRRR